MMLRLLGSLLSFTVLLGCGASVRVEDGGGGGGSADDGSFGGFGNGVSVGGASNDGGFGDGGGGFSSSDGPSTTVGTGGAPPEPGPACYLDSVPFYLPPDFFTGVETGQDVCSAEQIDSIAAVCLESQLTDDCWDWGFSGPENQACWDCVFFDGVGPELLPVVITGNSPYLTLYACAAHVLGLPQCEVPFQSLLFCAFTACEACDTNDDSWIECVDFAISSAGFCASIALPPGCDSLFELEAIPAECIGSATTIEEAFPILADYYCGAP